MTEDWQSFLTGVLFCAPACLILMIWAWRNRRGLTMKTDELKMAKFLLDKLVREYPSIFRKDGSIISASYVMGGADRKTTPTRAKNDIRLIRRLLMEVSKEL